MEVGLLIKSKILDADEPFYGHVKTLELNIKNFVLRKNPRKVDDNPKHPDYRIFTNNADGKEIIIGLGWRRTYEKDGISGEMVSLSFDDPSFRHPLHVTAFKSEEEYRWPITWRRRVQNAA